MRPRMFAAVAALPLALLSACSDGGGQLTVRFHYSHFEPSTLTVRAGEPVTFRLENEDPIEHEWIVGTEAVHEGHRTGTEAFHAEVPTEVTVPALETRETTVTFEEPGTYEYICHLPGHEAYGMRGTLRVVE